MNFYANSKYGIGSLTYRAAAQSNKFFREKEFVDSVLWRAESERIVIM
ncbi:hypothetical protein EPYR_00317 [Erwinia pyrifoliae DSM 12163]|nr:hypothetical protein EJP617_14700 [Erwinia sp. Ejp617]CAY72619.1 hypothetical protein EPYR_00317 [Erwinia pyrifoliae DSM 12163]